MGSDWYKSLNQIIYQETKESNQEKKWSTFIKNLPGNDDINMFLIQEHFYEKIPVFDHDYYHSRLPYCWLVLMYIRADDFDYYQDDDDDDDDDRHLDNDDEHGNC